MNKEKYIIKIEDIENAPQKTLQVDFEEHIEGIKSNEPIKSELTIKALGDFIEISGYIQGSAILECDLCLEEFEYELDFDLDELFAKDKLIGEGEEYGQETELKDGQFVTDLKGSQEIDIYDLLYQSVILDFPNKKVCGINCKGNTFLSDENLPQSETDPRLAVFKNINIEQPKADKKKL